MTTIPVESTTTTSDADLEERMDHWVCCDDPDGVHVKSFCGITTVPRGDADSVNCVVCTDLEIAHWCPNHGICPYA